MNLSDYEYYRDNSGIIYNGDIRKIAPLMESESVQTIVTSPPYWGLRDYQVEGQLGLESTPEEYIDNLVQIFRELRRVLRKDGTLWLNLGDSYAGSWNSMSHDLNGKAKRAGNNSRPPQSFTKSKRIPRGSGRWGGGNVPGGNGLKPKDLCMIPARVAIALQADGWWLRSDIIWSKPNPMPESVTDRPTTAHEHIFLLAKSKKYYYDADAIRERADGDSHSKGTKLHPPIEDAGIGHKDWHKYTPDLVEFRNKRSVWTVATHSYPKSHFATFPPKLIDPCILAGCPEGGVVLDPFGGAMTTAMVAKNLGRKYIINELKSEYIDMSKEDRLAQEILL